MEWGLLKGSASILSGISLLLPNSLSSLLCDYIWYSPKRAWKVQFPPKTSFCRVQELAVLNLAVPGHVLIFQAWAQFGLKTNLYIPCVIWQTRAAEGWKEHGLGRRPHPCRSVPRLSAQTPFLPRRAISEWRHIPGGDTGKGIKWKQVHVSLSSVHFVLNPENFVTWMSSRIFWHL